MRGTAAPAIAWRYLISKKSHSAVGAISAVSICGMAVATAAIICVLSVFNGFRDVIASRLDAMSPDIMVTPAKGKVFSNPDSVAAILSAMDGISLVMPSLTDNALAICGNREMPVTIKGVSMQSYRQLTALDSLLLSHSAEAEALSNGAEAESLSNGAEAEAEAKEKSEAKAEAYLSIGAASGLASSPGQEMLLFTPRRIGRVNLSNPAASFITDSVTVADVFRTDQSEFDENLVIIDIDLARNLLQYDNEASALEILTDKKIAPEKIAAAIESKLGAEFVVKDRMQQQEMNFRMISIEKWVTFLLLFFILIIASFNVISSLSMLVIEKQKSISTLRAIGFSTRGIGSIFFWESIFVTSCGGIAGILLGVSLTLLQQHFGFIKLQGDPSTLTVASYPVILNPADILVTLMPILVIGIATAFITAAFARSRSRASAETITETC